MQITINQKVTEIDGALSLAQVLAELNLAAEGVAVAVNNKVVPRAAWADMRLNEGDKLTVITAVCGG